MVMNITSNIFCKCTVTFRMHCIPSINLMLNHAGLILNATCDLIQYAVVQFLVHAQNIQVKCLGLNFVLLIDYNVNAFHSFRCK
jgi:hypothetical protein